MFKSNLEAVLYGRTIAQNREIAEAEEENEQLADAALKLKARYEAAQARIKELEAENGKLKIEAMDAAGRNAQVEALKAQHPASPLLADSGKRFKASGNAKTKLRLIYEAAFDAKGPEMGIANPADRRKD